MGSTRLPEKVMRDIKGRPMMDRVVGRAMRIPQVEETVVATSTLSRERRLVRHLEEQGVLVVRGPERDALTRYVQAADERDARQAIVPSLCRKYLGG
jgi:spore coat polysaccharide biosynthesis protein SpsF